MHLLVLGTLKAIYRNGALEHRLEIPRIASVRLYLQCYECAHPRAHGTLAAIEALDGVYRRKTVHAGKCGSIRRQTAIDHVLLCLVLFENAVLIFLQQLIQNGDIGIRGGGAWGPAGVAIGVKRALVRSSASSARESIP